MQYYVTVLVVTYNPYWEKLKLTLNSIVIQKDVKLQIVVSDDGSNDNLFDNINDYFKEKEFVDFKLLSHECNQGTVKNILDGLKLCDGEYVKFISPGDLFCADDILYQWVSDLAKNQAAVSFSKAIYYYKDATGYKAVKHYANPQCFKRNAKSLKKSYLLYDDIVLGAATIGLKNELLNYILLIADHVKFAEDNIYRIMIANGEKISFFNNESIYYEYGTGISTSSEAKWNRILKEDHISTDDFVLKFLEKDVKFKKKYLLCVKARKTGKIKDKIIKYICIPSKFIFVLKCFLLPKKTSNKLDLNYIKSLTDEEIYVSESF